MCQPRKWWLGLLPLAVIWLSAMVLLGPEIESELTHRINTGIAADMPWAKATLEGRDVYLQGVAPSEDAQRRAVEAISNVSGVRRAIANPAEIAPEIKPFAWSANRDASKVTLSGFVGADGEHGKVLAETGKIFPGVTVVDDMKDGRGAPPNHLAAMTAALAQLARLQNGSVALSDNLFSIKGAAADQATAASIRTAAKQMAAPVQTATVDISAPVPSAPVAAPAAQAQPRPSTPTTVAPVAAASAAPPAPVEHPFVWQAARADAVMTLSGFAPSEAARTQTIAAAKSATLGGRVVDQLKIAGGLPPGVDFAAATAFALSQLGQLRSGMAKLTDNGLQIEGLALDAASYRAASAALSSPLPAGLKMERADITPPAVQPYAWKASRSAKSLRFSGYYPDEVSGRTMASALQRFPNNLALQDDTTIASGAPAGFIPAMAMGLDQLSRLETGEAQIQGGKLTIEGVAASERIANEVKDAVSKLVGGMPVETRLTFVPSLAAPAAPAPVRPAAASAPTTPPQQLTAASPSSSPTVQATSVIPKPAAEVVAECTANLAASVRSGQILFQSSRALVLPASQPVIDRIAEAMKRCPAMTIEIGGHTDATGNPTLNETLSKSRADAISSLLARAGVDANRMRTAGYGSSKPVADNETSDGKAKNRRIEFNVVE